MNDLDDPRRALHEAYLAVFAKPHEVLAAVEACDTENEAIEAIERLLELPESSARAVVNLQLFRFVGSQRRRIRSELAKLTT